MSGRDDLLARRRVEYPKVDSMDFAPGDGFCRYRNVHLPGEPRCGYDLVSHYGEGYPTAFITGCPHCGSSYCD
jgi:hypothetical protein